MPYKVHKLPSNLPIKGWIVGGLPANIIVGFEADQKDSAVRFAQEWAQDHETLHVVPVIDHGLGLTLLAGAEDITESIIQEMHRMLEEGDYAESVDEDEDEPHHPC